MCLTIFPQPSRLPFFVNIHLAKFLLLNCRLNTGFCAVFPVLIIKSRKKKKSWLKKEPETMASWKNNFYATEATTGFVATWVTTALMNYFLERRPRRKFSRARRPGHPNLHLFWWPARGKRETMRNIEKWIGQQPERWIFRVLLCKATLFETRTVWINIFEPAERLSHEFVFWKWFAISKKFSLSLGMRRWPRLVAGIAVA